MSHSLMSKHAFSAKNYQSFSNPARRKTPNAGRKAPHTSHTESEFWSDNVVGPSERRLYSGIVDSSHVIPREFTIDEFQEIVNAFGPTATRVSRTGLNMIETHDRYDGSLKNRTLLFIEIIHEVRSNLSAEKSVSVHISASDNLEYLNDRSSSCEMGICDTGVDVPRDVTLGDSSALQKNDPIPGCQTPFAENVKKAVHGLGCSGGRRDY
ncbi:hypothetical protein BGX21_003941 [Mortierella sp. AD011]|nr:hypothetical protein BGX21_003941 [Mortierella sp. AD011]